MLSLFGQVSSRVSSALLNGTYSNHLLRVLGSRCGHKYFTCRHRSTDTGPTDTKDEDSENTEFDTLVDDVVSETARSVADDGSSIDLESLSEESLDPVIKKHRQSAYTFRCYHPTLEVFDMKVNGKKYGEVPFLKITCKRNNTFMLLCEGVNGKKVYAAYSTSQIGFHGVRKKTPLASQALSLRLTQAARENNIDMVRVIVRGFGPGRQACLKGLELSGLRVLSITDDTKFPHGRPRGRKRI